MNDLFGKKEDIVTYDFQGWPVYRMTLRNILDYLGFEKMENEGNVYWRIADKNPIMNIHPRVLRDDGMGYGVDERWITEFSVVEDNGEPKWINVFAEKQDDEETLKKYEEID